MAAHNGVSQRGAASKGKPEYSGTEKIFEFGAVYEMILNILKHVSSKL